MANRRDFLAAGAASVALPVSLAAAQAEGGVGISRDLIELRRYVIDNEAQKAGLDAYFRDAAIPAYNRIGITPVGVFYPEKDPSPIYVLLRHRSAESVLTSTAKLLADAEYLQKGAAFLDAPAKQPAFRRLESVLLLAFKGMPSVETPVTGPGRVLQVRIYESPSARTGQKKIEMFNEAGEIAIFRRTGLHPVFFGESLVGDKLPNLTYMLAFESAEQLKANWATFIADPEWKKISKLPEYANEAILSGITNIILKPAEYSQV